ncbi:chitin disaccharide deacetylase [Lentibacillus sp. Marseille-P4043]|uniref:chitin disaccharide deacetylase n=1 Tax=Lentibacillus sp. Marseille-P4043 TaxID=2040293 RepID=UPI000D0B889B|nr:chitin disaccharide deacetylase [Lentibacillus sp. Marseille-P4043]
MKVLFNADDFGLTKGVTDGIIKAHINGVVGATTIMMNGYAVDYAVTQAKQHPSLKVGVHLVLTWGKPLRNDVPNLVTSDGTFIYKNTFRDMPYPNVDQVEQEWRTQINAFLKTGLPLHHLDSHHHVHGWEPLKKVIIKLAAEYDVPVRYVESLADHHDILLTDTLWVDFYGDGVNENVFEELRTLNVNTVEVMTHPAYIDDELLQVSSYLDKRKEELGLLCKLATPSWVDLL